MKRRESFYWHLLSVEFASKLPETRVRSKQFTNSKCILIRQLIASNTLASGLNRPASPVSISSLIRHGQPERLGYTSTGLGNCL
jgi:hypothetical protein